MEKSQREIEKNRKSLLKHSKPPRCVDFRIKGKCDIVKKSCGCEFDVGENKFNVRQVCDNHLTDGTYYPTPWCSKCMYKYKFDGSCWFSTWSYVGVNWCPNH